MRFSITEIPQADELDKVILTAEAVFNDNISDQQIADYVGFTDRQGRYYRLAAEILGLLLNLNNKAELTTIGKELVELDNEHRLKKIRKIISTNPFFSDLLRFIESNREGANRREILNYLIENVDGAESTITRRISTVLSWLTHIDLVNVDYKQTPEGDKENVFIFNNNLIDEESSTDSDVKDSIYPANYTNKELDIKEGHIQVYGLLKKNKEDKIVVPEFQRNQVWKQQQKSRFIESLILNIPIPPFYVSQDLDGTYIIIDGLQRTTSIMEFLSDSYNLVGLEALPHLNGQKFSQLEEGLKARIEDRDLLLYILKSSVPLGVVYDIFNRINSNGTPLTRQEIRNCIYIGHSTRLLKELAETVLFRTAIDNGIPGKRMKDREAILRFFAFAISDLESEYKGDMDDFLSKAMRKINHLSTDEILSLKARFLRVIKKTFEFFGARNFRVPTENSRGRINIAVMETICVFFDKHPDYFFENNKELIISNFNKLFSDPLYNESIKFATGSIKNVKTRFERSNKILSSNLKYD